MEYLLGAIGMMAFLLCVYIAYRQGQKKSDTFSDIPEDERERQERLMKDFEKMLGYNLDTALKRKQVK